jgi:hypothetical protein
VTEYSIAATSRLRLLVKSLLLGLAVGGPLWSAVFAAATGRSFGIVLASGGIVFGVLSGIVLSVATIAQIREIGVLCLAMSPGRNWTDLLRELETLGYRQTGVPKNGDEVLDFSPSWRAGLFAVGIRLKRADGHAEVTGPKSALGRIKRRWNRRTAATGRFTA